LQILPMSFDGTTSQVSDRTPQIELFFKWIKQHLRIKNFFGSSDSCVKTQVWIAVAVYVLVAIVKKRLGLKHDLYNSDSRV
jgi:IS4 transposase